MAKTTESKECVGLQVYRIDPTLKQSDIDNAEVNWVIFPNCGKCNPTSWVIQT